MNNAINLPTADSLYTFDLIAKINGFVKEVKGGYVPTEQRLVRLIGRLYDQYQNIHRLPANLTDAIMAAEFHLIGAGYNIAHGNGRAWTAVK